MATQSGETSLPVNNRPLLRRDVTVEPYPLRVPVVVESPASNCSCASGSGIEQKIKENPMLFVLGALLVGYLLAKN